MGRGVITVTMLNKMTFRENRVKIIISPVESAWA